MKLQNLILNHYKTAKMSEFLKKSYVDLSYPEDVTGYVVYYPLDTDDTRCKKYGYFQLVDITRIVPGHKVDIDKKATYCELVCERYLPTLFVRSNRNKYMYRMAYLFASVENTAVNGQLGDLVDFLNRNVGSGMEPDITAVYYIQQNLQRVIPPSPEYAEGGAKNNHVDLLKELLPRGLKVPKWFAPEYSFSSSLSGPASSTSSGPPHSTTDSRKEREQHVLPLFLSDCKEFDEATLTLHGKCLRADKD